MSPRGDFPCFMVEVEIGSNPKIARLTDRELRILVCGIWPLAAKAKPRGYLVVADEPATEHDIAHQAHCTLTQARAAMVKLRKLRMVERDDEAGLEYCHDWHDLNPDPKPSDSRDARRERKRRERDRHANVTRDNGANVTPVSRECHAPEVKGEEKEKKESAKADSVAAAPPSAEDRALEERVAYLVHLASSLIRTTHGISAKSKEALPIKAWHDACRSMLTADGFSAEQVEFAIRWVCKHHYWSRRIRSMTRLRSEMEQVADEIRKQRDGGNVVPMRGRKESSGALLRAMNGEAS